MRALMFETLRDQLKVTCGSHFSESELGLMVTGPLSLREGSKGQGATRVAKSKEDKPCEQSWGPAGDRKNSEMELNQGKRQSREIFL